MSRERKSHERKSFSEKYNRKSGIYILTPKWLFRHDFPPDQKFLVKIGESSNYKTKRDLTLSGLARRIDHYLSYYVEGFYLWGVFVTDLKNSKKLEASVHSYLRGKRRDFNTLDTHVTHSRSSEWFYLSKNDLRDILHILNNDSDLRSVITESYSDTAIVEMNNKISTRTIPPMSTPQRRLVDAENRVEMMTNERPRSLREGQENVSTSRTIKRRLF